MNGAGPTVQRLDISGCRYTASIDIEDIVCPPASPGKRVEATNYDSLNLCSTLGENRYAISSGPLLKEAGTVLRLVLLPSTSFNGCNITWYEEASLLSAKEVISWRANDLLLAVVTRGKVWVDC